MSYEQTDVVVHVAQALISGANGYLISGTILYYLAQTGYQALPNAVLPPTQELAASLDSLMTYLPPHLLGEPGIYFAVILSFIFVIVVYI